MNVFDFVSQIQYGKKNLLTPETEKTYITFMVNRSLSYHIDALMQANDMNRYYDLPKKMQHDYLMASIRNRKRKFEKWIKKEKNEDIESVMKYFNYSISKARDVLRLLSKEQLEEIRNKLNLGGLKA